MFIGIDLAASQKRPSGFCILNKKAKTFLIYSNEEIICEVKKAKPKVIAIDAPLSIPKGKYRKCDIEIIKAGIPIFSFRLPSLKKLAKRAINLKKKIRFKIIETYPYAVLRLNKNILTGKKFKTKHEKDAFVCALVAKKFFEKKARCFSGGGKIYF
ncbi:MAG: DUF429 domain-containing protein [Candidatus Pacearchaeota archaeon]|nr:DUF429 domain-containing protein [Candidatus Pacearchaeota archaeon]